MLRFICDIWPYQFKYRTHLPRKVLDRKFSLVLKNYECNFLSETIWLRDMANY
jgi:hypothetical protein